VDGARTSTGAALAELRKDVGVAAETAVILANTAAVPHPPVARGLDQNHPVVGRRRAACVEPLPLAVLRHLCANYHGEIHQPKNTSRLNTAHLRGGSMISEAEFVTAGSRHESAFQGQNLRTHVTNPTYPWSRHCTLSELNTLLTTLDVNHLAQIIQLLSIKFTIWFLTHKL